MKQYAVREIFLTLQGEGYRTGQASVFVRFAGCNLWNGKPEDRNKGKGACRYWCDTDFAKGDLMTSNEILEQAESLWRGASHKWLVITGGEPLLQLDEAFIVAAHARSWKIAVESNGTRLAPAGIDWLTISPKLGTHLINQFANELKVVLPGGSLGGWPDAKLEEFELNGWATNLYVQPQDVILRSAVETTYLKRSLLGAEPEFKLNLKRCTDFVLSHPRWKLSYQVHKITGMR